VVLVDLHIHTVFSGDSTNRVCHIRTALRRLAAVAICDHNTITGAIKFRRIFGERVIVGIEIDTSEGEIIGLFVRQEVRKGLGLCETVRLLREQGAFIFAPHPFDARRKGAGRRLLKVIDSIDGVEVFNARTVSSEANALAESFAEEHRLCAISASDAHTPFEIGKAAVMLPYVPRGREQLISMLKNGYKSGRKITLLERCYARIRRTLRF